MTTSTVSFGTTPREGHDTTGFYDRELVDVKFSTTTETSEVRLPDRRVSAKPDCDRMGTTLHRVKVEVAQIRPVIWRRFDIDSEATLDDLHMAIQIGFGWENFHLHHFEIGYDRYSSSPNHSGDNRDSRSVRLGDVSNAGDILGYVYDYGDNWVVVVTVEKVVAKRGAKPFVGCTHGRRAGPPEDIGGPWGYDELVNAMKKRRGAAYRHWRELNGGIFDPVDFDLEETNRALEHSIGR